MKISTREYLEDLKKAKREGVEEGREREARLTRAIEEEKEVREHFGRLTNHLNRLENHLCELDKRIREIELRDCKTAEGVEVE